MAMQFIMPADTLPFLVGSMVTVHSCLPQAGNRCPCSPPSHRQASWMVDPYPSHLDDCIPFLTLPCRYWKEEEERKEEGRRYVTW